MSEELPRETGSEKTTVTCGTCGKELPAVSSAYGSVTAGECPTCSKGAKAAAKEAEKEAKEAAKVEEKEAKEGAPEPTHPMA